MSDESSNNNSNNSTNPQSVGEMPFGSAVEAKINGAIASGARHLSQLMISAAKQMLAAGTDPFFRREMGDRYFTAGSIQLGYGLWFVTGIASVFLWIVLGMAVRTIRNALIFQIPIMPVVAGITSLVILSIFRKCAFENLAHVAEFRSEGKPYHSRSYGVARWEPAVEHSLHVVGGLALLALAPISGIAFFISRSMGNSLIAQQQAAFYERYIDAMDAKLDGELLQNALLGKCPPELTFIYKPLPETKNPQVREDVAASVVGKAIVVAQGPKKPSATPPVPPKESPQPTPATESAQRSTSHPQTSPTPEARPGGATRSSSKLWLIAIGLCLIVGSISAFQKFSNRKPEPQILAEKSQPSPNVAPAPRQQDTKEPDIVTTTPKASSATPAEAVQVDTPKPETAAPEISAVAQAPIPTNVASTEQEPTASSKFPIVVVQPPPPSGPTDEEIRQREQKAREEAEKVALEQKQAQVVAEMEKIRDQIGTLITNQLDEIPKFQTNCNRILTAALNKKGTYSTQQKDAIKQLQTVVDKSVQSQLTALQQWQSRLPAFANTPQTSWQLQLDKVTKNIQAMTTQRQQMAAQIMLLKKD